ncbi:MAG: MBL fold metallo-hydrolase [Candidatus Pacearchaeota archaeon]
MKIKNIELDWLGHACFKLRINNKIIYIDPYKLGDSENLEKADYVLITHEHYDHLSLEDLKKIAKDGTIVIGTADCQSTLARLQPKITIKIALPGASFKLDDFELECIPAYNIGKRFHPKVHDWVGYVIKTKELIIYHAGDTDVIPEQDNLKKYAERLVMLLPVGGTYTMDWKEASELVKKIRPWLAIPMHYAKIVGSVEDAMNFVKEVEKAKLRAQLLEEEK